MLNKNNKKLLINNGFTIIELLVVIVIIAILATIIVISYNGIQKSATVSKLKTNLTNCKKSLELYKAEYGVYPTNTDANNIDFPTICTKPSNDIFFAYTTGPNALTYKLIQSSGNVIVVDTESTTPTEDTSSTVKWASISTGKTFTCAISYSGSAYCWGNNDYGQLGDNTIDQRRVPTPVIMPTGKKFISISTGNNNTCAITTDNLAYCWGNNGSGKLGDNTTTQRNVPTAVRLNGEKFKSISTGYLHTCAISTDNLVFCWGYNIYGQLGDGTNISTRIPKKINDNKYISISTINNHTCAISIESLAYCWGYNNFGRIGDNTNISKNIPTEVQSNGLKFTSISAGFTHTCAISTDNLAYCWGYNDHGQHGYLIETNYGYVLWLQKSTPNPVDMPEGKKFTSISAGYDHTCATSIDNLVYCWGDENVNQLIQENMELARPIIVNTTNNIYVTKSGGCDCSITTDGLAYCWGSNYDGMLGIGDSYPFTQESDTAVEVKKINR